MCLYRVRNIQGYHQESLGLNDISYNFLIGGDGHVYEGSGFNYRGACADLWENNTHCICIAFIGNFATVPPTNGQLESTQQLLGHGIAMKKLSPYFHLYTNNEVKETDIPGTMLYNIIKSWHYYRFGRNTAFRPKT